MSEAHGRDPTLPKFSVGFGVIVVVAIVAVLAIVSALIPPNANKGNTASRRHWFEVQTAIHAYRLEHRVFPFCLRRTRVDYDRLTTVWDCEGQYRVLVEGHAVVGDPRGIPYRVEEHDVREYELVGAGPDEAFGTPDDLRK